MGGGGDHGDDHHEPDFNFKEYPPIKESGIVRFIKGVSALVTGPVSFFRGT